MQEIIFSIPYFPAFHIIINVGDSDGQQAKKEENKMATFFNQASISYRNTVINSNVAEGELISGVGLTKTAVSTDYTVGGGVIYVITLTNASATAVDGITLTDNLGAYTVGTSTVVPLTYVDGSIQYYTNGVLQNAPTVVAVGDLTISDISIPAGGNATIIYEARANEFAPLTAGSTITNTVTTSGTPETLSATDTVGVRNEAELNIAKAICPAVITNSGEVTYTFIIQNSGNLATELTDNIIVSDVFNPILTNIAVTLDGEPLTAGTDYTYSETTGAFTTSTGVVTVPTATYTQDQTTGQVITTPGVATLVITGTI